MSENSLDQIDQDTSDSINFEPDGLKNPVYRRTWFIVTTAFILLFLAWVVISVALAYFNVKKGNYQAPAIDNTTSVISLPPSES